MTSTSFHNEKETLLAIANGDEAAFAHIFRAHWEHIYSVAFSIVKSSQQAGDIVQEVFVKLWTNRSQLASVEQFDSYLFVLARNHIFNELKKAARQDKFIKDIVAITNEQALTPDQELLLKESKTVLENAVASLPQQQQMVYRLSKEGGFKYDQIAEKLQISKATVRNHMIHALRSIREKLSDHQNGTVLLLCLLLTLGYI